MTFETQGAEHLAEEGKAAGSGLPQKRIRYVMANAAAFLLNCVFVAIPGRLDQKLGKEDWPGNGVVAYATPALYAFAIWGAIYITELIFTFWQVTQGCGQVPAKRADMLVALSPGWCAAHVGQAVWCLVYREWTFSAGLFWLPALVLSCAALAMSFAHRAAAAGSEGMEECLVMAPISMHCGWITAAALLNWNQWITILTTSLTVRITTLCVSLALAAIAAIAVSVPRRAPGYMCTVAWAIIALGVQASNSDIMAAELGRDNLTILATVELAVGGGLAAFGICMKGYMVKMAQS